MADANPPSQDPNVAAASAGLSATQSMFSTTLVISDEVKAQFPDVLDLIVHSESMNDEERQYWINILPIMTPEQLQNLKDILGNERQQLAAIDAKYEKEIDKVGEGEFLKQVEQERKARADKRTSAEQQAKSTEDTATDDILKQIEGA